MQEILFAIFFLAIGFVLLIKGADFFVDGSSAVAKLLRVPPIIIGLTVVAMGTSLPELAVSVTAAMSGNNALAVSNVVGSNIFNLMVVCGMCAVFTPALWCAWRGLWRLWRWGLQLIGPPRWDGLFWRCSRCGWTMKNCCANTAKIEKGRP